MWRGRPFTRERRERSSLREGAAGGRCEGIGGGGGEVFFFFPGDCRLVEVPTAVSFTGIQQAPAVGAETDGPFLFRRIGNPFGGAVIDGGDKHFTPHHKGDLLAVGRKGHLGGIF